MYLTVSGLKLMIFVVRCDDSGRIMAAIGREHDEGSIYMTGGTPLFMGVSLDVLAVNGS